jgi:REP element-mobilizing transposase RayT
VLFPQGYHVTFGTYGSRLPGSSKPYVDRWHNQYGQPLPQPNPKREQTARQRMKFSEVHLTLQQRQCVEQAVSDLAARYSWTIHAMAAQSDHVHVVITAPREGQALRDAIKAVASRALNQTYGKRPWWAEGGSARCLWEPEYFRAAVEYVKGQRDFP